MVDGEHDISTVAALTCEFAGAIGGADSSLLIDLSGVTFMDVSTVDLLVRTKLYLLSESRELFLCSPKKFMAPDEGSIVD